MLAPTKVAESIRGKILVSVMHLGHPFSSHKREDFDTPRSKELFNIPNITCFPLPVGSLKSYSLIRGHTRYYRDDVEADGKSVYRTRMEQFWDTLRALTKTDYNNPLADVVTNVTCWIFRDGSVTTLVDYIGKSAVYDGICHLRYYYYSKFAQQSSDDVYHRYITRKLVWSNHFDLQQNQMVLKPEPITYHLRTISINKYNEVFVQRPWIDKFYVPSKTGL